MNSVLNRPYLRHGMRTALAGIVAPSPLGFYIINIYIKEREREREGEREGAQLNVKHINNRRLDLSLMT